MQQYIGVKLINVKPMTRLEYNQFRGWELPADENGADDGFLVEYVDGGKANTAEYAGYVSWSPKDVFERAYRPCTNMTFGLAIEALKADERVARAGWNWKGMWLALAGRDGNWSASVDGGSMPKDWRGNLPFIAMYTEEEHLVPWFASQSDMLAEDWLIVE